MGIKLVYGVGVSDAGYVLQNIIDGKHFMCPFYSAWSGMLRRCYSPETHQKRPTYIGCSACDEWKLFSCFKAWMQKQDWEGKHLDKDILFEGNKIYSPDTCAFVDSATNSFFTDSAASRDGRPVGTQFHKLTGKFQAQCNNSITKKREHLGLFSCANQAHEAWRKRKHEIACQLADLQTDERVALALRTRYL